MVNSLRKLLVIVLSFAFLLLCYMVVKVTWGLPLRLSEGKIRDWVLKRTPLGTSLEQVRVYTDSKAWRDRFYVEDGGTYWGHNYWLDGNAPAGQTVGDKSIRGDLGDYLNAALGTTQVTAFWGFDTNDQLVNVWVQKSAGGHSDLDKICSQLLNSYECAQAVERVQLKKYAKFVSRQNDTLTIKLKDGTSVALENLDQVFYSFRDFFKNENSAVVDVQYYEGGEYLIIDIRNGKRTTTEDIAKIFPVPSRTLAY